MTHFWANSASDPKRNFRFKVSIEGFNSSSAEQTTDLIWFAKKATKPSFTVGEVKANFVDKSFYYPGRVEWNTCEITFYDPVSPNAVNVLTQMFANSGYFIPNTPTLSTHWSSTSKANATNGSSVGAVLITTIDENGNSLEEWTLNNAFVKSMKFGEASYDSDDLMEVTVEFRYDWATLKSGSAFEILTQSDAPAINGVVAVPQ
tara:strand:- start:416 stop:1027 length:612 start_codon:yes stop_codon:yes gene_type:complete